MRRFSGAHTMTISRTNSILDLQAPRSTSKRRVSTAELRKLFETDDGTAPLVARVALGAILLPHGAQHALGWFGGYGFSGTLGWMTGTLGFPAPLAALGIVSEL